MKRISIVDSVCVCVCVWVLPKVMWYSCVELIAGFIKSVSTSLTSYY